MSYISFSVYVKEKNLSKGTNIRIPNGHNHPKNMHKKLKIIIDEILPPYQCNVTIFDEDRLILPYSPIYKPEENPLNQYYPTKDLNSWLSTGRFKLKKIGKKYCYEKKEDYRCMIETIRFKKKKNGKYNLFWMIES